MHISAPSVIWQLKLPKQVTSLASGAAFSTFFSVASDHARKVRNLHGLHQSAKVFLRSMQRTRFTITTSIAYLDIKGLSVYLVYLCFSIFVPPSLHWSCRGNWGSEATRLCDFPALFSLYSHRVLSNSSAEVAHALPPLIQSAMWTAVGIAGCIEGLIDSFICQPHRPSTKLQFGELGVILGLKKTVWFQHSSVCRSTITVGLDWKSQKSKFCRIAFKESAPVCLHLPQWHNDRGEPSDRVWYHMVSIFSELTSVAKAHEQNHIEESKHEP